MTNCELVQLLQLDLTNERKHLAFYLNASVMVQGLHREEISELLHEEAKSELEHVREFSQMIVYLGGKPTDLHWDFPLDLTDPYDILKYAMDMENEVAKNYAERLRQTHEMSTPEEAALHVFYEDQISDSWRAAKEFEQMIKRQKIGHQAGPTLYCDPNVPKKPAKKAPVDRTPKRSM